MTKIKKNQKKQNFYAYIGAWVSIVGNTVLAVLKFIAGMYSNSVAVIADAWHTLSDTISSIIVLISIRVSEKNATQKFPYGFGRADTIASGILSVLLAVVCIEFFIKGVEKLINKHSAEYKIIVYIAMGLTIVFKEIMAQISIWGAKKSGKKSLKADAWHHRSDAISSAFIIIGVVLNKYFWWIDGVLSIFISLIIAYTSFTIMRDVGKSVIGENPNFEMKQKIKKIVNNAAQMQVYPHHIHLHSYGNHHELTMHIYLPPDLEISLAHNLTDVIESALKQEMNIIATIHIEPLPENIIMN